MVPVTRGHGHDYPHYGGTVVANTIIEVPWPLSLRAAAAAAAPPNGYAGTSYIVPLSMNYILKISFHNQDSLYIARICNAVIILSQRKTLVEMDTMLRSVMLDIV